ncbi:MAG: hypothetical protein J5777_02635 [Clostridiales bacterium]|nr:hypothetical protein [Clostridiales bacterium]
MEFMSGEDFLIGLRQLSKHAAEAPWALKEHDLPKGHWRRVVNPDEGAEAFFIIITDKYVIGIKTGRVLFLDKKTKKRLAPIMGFHDLVSGDVKSDGSELVVLEHGKHFHVISLETFEVVKKVTLPRGYMATDVYCTYSEDGKILTVPVSKYDYDKRQYVYLRCEYETEGYTLLSKTEITRKEVDFWTDSK